MRNDKELKELADKHGIKTYNRRFIDVKDEQGGVITKFVDLPKSRAQLVDELRDQGVLPG